MTDGRHALAEARSLALHERVAERIAEDASLVDAARARVRRWRDAGLMHPRWAARWSTLLDLPLGQLRAALLDPGQEGRDLRQSSPFAGVVPPRERWQIWRRCGEEFRAS